MGWYGDLHIHSRFARATSKNLTLPVLDKYAQKKGITLIGTGDFTHPLWFKEISEQLEPAEQGLFKLKLDETPVRFVLSVEISSIYTQGERGRRVHNLVLLPTFEAARTFNQSLERRGAKLASDGRPMIGLSSKELANLALMADEKALIIPAHAWTPWFGVLGSMSGFDSIEECFEELTPNILAIETGLSSDPPMNWRLSKLDNVALVSFSDAHSPSKLGRELTQFDGELSYTGLYEALKAGAPKRASVGAKSSTKLLGTVEFFPEEGKYHFDGHREHKIRWSPAETIRNHFLCPVCGRRVTVGVLSRVEALADRADGFRPDSAPDYRRMVPLIEIIAEAFGIGISSKKVIAAYDQLIAQLGNELTILTDSSLTDIETASNPLIAEGVKRVRAGTLHIEPGYDGEFGTVHVFDEEERSNFNSINQASLF